MLLPMDFQAALAFIQSPERIRQDTIIPYDFPECPDSTYRSGYDWLYLYERDIARFLEPWLKPYRYDLIGEKGLLCEALSNAFAHGHDKDPKKAMVVEVYLGKQGLLLRISDSGKGFNVKRVYQKYRQKKTYFHTAGNGVHLMATSHRFGVFYNTLGSTCHLLYVFNKHMGNLAKTDKALAN